MTETPDSAALWLAVDRLTQPTTRRLTRDDHGPAQAELIEELRRQQELAAVEPEPALIPRIPVRVSRNDLARYTQIRRGHATVPSLWDQSTDALTTGSEQSEGRAKQVHRTPCDVDLMEIRATIRETIAHQLEGRSLVARDTVPAQMRQLAAHVVTHEPQHVDWWEFRFAQWARVLAVYLQAVQAQPRPRRIRSFACPECSITTVLIEDSTGEKVNVPPIVIDFTSDGLVRAAECAGCGKAWFRGEDLEILANLVNKETA